MPMPCPCHRLGFGSTYEGLKPERANRPDATLTCFGSTYEGLKRVAWERDVCASQVLAVPMRA